MDRNGQTFKWFFHSHLGTHLNVFHFFRNGNAHIAKKAIFPKDVVSGFSKQEGQKDEEQGIPERNTPTTPAPGRKGKMGENGFIIIIIM